MKIWFKVGKDSIQLPVVPEEVMIQTGADIQTVNIVSAGEFAVKGNKRLNAVSLSSFFPGTETQGGYQTSKGSKYHNAYTYVKKINTWKNSKTVVTVIVQDEYGKKHKLINDTFLISEFEYGQVDGSGDISYTISFTEYRKLSVKVTKNGVTTLLTNRTTKTIPATYTVKKGDTWKSIAKYYYGTSSKADYIAKLNKKKTTDKLKVGTKIKLK